MQVISSVINVGVRFFINVYDQRNCVVLLYYASLIAIELVLYCGEVKVNTAYQGSGAKCYRLMNAVF